MDEPDAPLDPNPVKGPAVRDSREVPAAPSILCADRFIARSLAERMATGTLSAEEIRGPARRLVRHLLRGCPDCAVAFGLAAGWRAGRLPLFHYEARVNRGIRRTIEGWQGRKVERERAEALIAEVRKLRRDDPEFGIALLEEALRRVEKAVASSSGSGPRGEGLACEIHTERANLLRLLGRHLEAEAAFQAGLEAWQADIGRAEALLNLGDLYGSFLIDRRRFTEADGLQSLATGL